MESDKAVSFRAIRTDRVRESPTSRSILFANFATAAVMESLSYTALVHSANANAREFYRDAFLILLVLDRRVRTLLTRSPSTGVAHETLLAISLSFRAIRMDILRDSPTSRSIRLATRFSAAPMFQILLPPLLRRKENERTRGVESRKKAG